MEPAVSTAIYRFRKNFLLQVLMYLHSWDVLKLILLFLNFMASVARNNKGQNFSKLYIHLFPDIKFCPFIYKWNQELALPYVVFVKIFNSKF